MVVFAADVGPLLLIHAHGDHEERLKRNDLEHDELVEEEAERRNRDLLRHHDRLPIGQRRDVGRVQRPVPFRELGIGQL